MNLFLSRVIFTRASNFSGFFSTLLFVISLSNADTLNISGFVHDEFNRPIAGAEVSLYKRNSLATFTDASGEFMLTGDTDIPLKTHRINSEHKFELNEKTLNIDFKPGSQAEILIYDLNGININRLPTTVTVTGSQKINLPLTRLTSGVYLLVFNQNGIKTVVKHVVSANAILCGKIFTTNKDIHNKIISSRQVQAPEFIDIMVVSSEGTQTVRQAITSSVEHDLNILLMPLGAGNVTPGISVFTDKGGTGDVTTYGSVSEPEFSQGGACNYGSTAIRYYAAINVNQFPSDLKGQWQNGQICGACARVRIRTKEGEIRTTVVRIVDKCPDDNCGIDLGGAPAAVIMKDQPGRYYGEWEWVSCDGFEGVSDGPPALSVKAGSNQFWSLVQVRNGSGAVSEIRVRKAGTTQWQSLQWAIEAENYFKLPVELIQDNDDWELEVLWKTGVVSSLRLQGNKLAVENASYPLVQN